jgi:hypothetical protein
MCGSIASMKLNSAGVKPPGRSVAKAAAWRPSSLNGRCMMT